jgi:phosphate transport system substrate-binding protein
LAQSDAPLSDEQLKQAPGKIFHFPSVMGAVVLAHNLKSVNNTLKLTGPVIADIFMGKITKWNDPAIAILNPAVPLPDSNIKYAPLPRGVVALEDKQVEEIELPK